MPAKNKEIMFDELDESSRVLLLRAFDYDVDGEGYILSPAGKRIQSPENPKEFLHARTCLLAPGSLRILDGTPTSISKLIREAGSTDEPSA